MERDSEEDVDFSERVLCSDGGCIGIVNDNGYCGVCGKPYSGDPSELPFSHLLRWSENPGWRERHLKRRYRNPLFPPKSRFVNLEEFQEARSADDDEKSLVMEQINFLINVFWANAPTIEDALKLLEELGDVIRDCQLCGLSSEIQHLFQFKGDLLARIKEFASNRSEEALRNLEKYDATLDYKGARTEHNLLILEITKIPRADIIPTILSAEMDDFMRVLEIIKDTATMNALKEGAMLISHELKLSGVHVPGIDDKVKLISES